MGRAPLIVPSFHGLLPPSLSLAARRASGDDSLGRARLDGGVGLSGAQRASFGSGQLLQTTMQTGGNVDGAGGGRAGPVDTNDISGNGGSFVFGLKGEKPNMAEVLDLPDLLDSIIDRQILDGSDALSNCPEADENEVVRREKAFMVGIFLRSYGTMRHTLVLQLRWVVL